MSGYINRDELLKIRPFTCYVGLSVSEYDEGFLDCADEAREAIKNLPAVDVAPVVHARWINIPPYECASGYKKGQECSECHTYYVSDGNAPWSNHKYCAECGAKMDLEE